MQAIDFAWLCKRWVRKERKVKNGEENGDLVV